MSELFCHRIKSRRIALGLNQHELGLKCGFTKTTKHRISLYEKGKNLPNAEDLFYLARALGVTAEWLIFGDETKGTHPTDNLFIVSEKISHALTVMEDNIKELKKEINVLKEKIDNNSL